MQTTVETELKLDADEGFRLPDLPGEPLETRTFTSTYYDNASRSLARSAITLRRRVENGLSRWQLKLPKGGHIRAEIEAGGGPASPPPEIAALLAAHLRHGALEPIATLRTRRAGTRVMSNGTAVADVTLDLVDILDGMKDAGHFAELEVELVDGDEDDLERIGRTLRRAGARVGDSTPKVMRVVGVPTERKTANRIQALVRDQLLALETHDPGVRLGADPEDVHRFRVATRRLRAVVRATQPVFGDLLAPVAAELKWLAGLLGAVRDLDVLLARLRTDVARLDEDRDAGEELVAILEEEHGRVRDELVAALESARYLDLLARLEAAVDALPSVDDVALSPLAAGELRKLKKAAKVSEGPADDELHALRIRAKRARYAAELLPGDKRVARYLDALKHVQDVIGEHQDAVVAEGRLRLIARERTAVAAGRLIERERERKRARRAEYADAVDDALAAGVKALR